MDEQYADAAPTVQHHWRQFERKLFRMQARVERQALALYARDPDKAAAYLTRYSCKEGMRSLRLALWLQERVAGLVE